MTGDLDQFLGMMFGGNSPRRRRRSSGEVRPPRALAQKTKIAELQEGCSESGRRYLLGAWGAARVLVVQGDDGAWSLWMRPAPKKAAGRSGVSSEVFEALNPAVRAAATRAGVKRA